MMHLPKNHALDVKNHALDVKNHALDVENSCTSEQATYLNRESSDDDKRHIKMGLLFELETIESSTGAFYSLW